jgi:alkylation response protein AidB-like acyl-CoA dehydrogenase
MLWQSGSAASLTLLFNPQLGGPTALLKAQSTKVFEYCAREAAQVFGGASYVRGGQGEKARAQMHAARTPASLLTLRCAAQVERLYREVRAYAIPGGSEEVMLDLAVRQAMKDAKLAKL